LSFLLAWDSSAALKNAGNNTIICYFLYFIVHLLRQLLRQKQGLWADCTNGLEWVFRDPSSSDRTPIVTERMSWLS